MIRFEVGPKPVGFEAKVEQPGAKWLAKNLKGRPRDLWGAFKPQLADAFRSLCAYGSMYEPVGTVDHFVGIDEDRSKAYQWANYRFASAWLNSSKQDLRSSQLVDPFEVQEGWFEVQLPSLQMVLADGILPELRARAQLMLERMHLGHDERIVRQRREWLRMYEEGELTLEGLAKKAPLIAAAVERSKDA